MRRLVKYFNPGVCQAWQEWVKRHEKSLIWSLQVLNLTCLERVYNWFLDIGNTATVKRQLSSQAIEASPGTTIMSMSTISIAHCCTIFLKSSGYRNIAQGGDPIYAGVD